MGKIIDISNQKFGRLSVIEYVGMKDHCAMWHCKCDCGKEIVVRGMSLRSGNTKSCGCFNRDQTSKSRSKHHMSRTKIYYVWSAIKKRCFNQNDKEYDLYGERGITMHPEWVNDFKAFYDYVSKLPHFGEKGYTIDRINNNGNYEPNNLRMATYSEQAMNRNKKRWYKKPLKEEV